MKQIFTLLLLFISAAAFSQATYYWVGGTSGTWSSSGSWNTQLGGGGSSRTSANNADQLIFDGTNIGGGATGVVTPTITGNAIIGQLRFVNGANVILQRGSAGSGTTTLTVNGDGTAAEDFTVDATSEVTLTSPGGGFGIALQLGVATTNVATGSVHGKMNINDAGITGTSTNVRFTSHNPNALRFAAGSIVRTRLTSSTTIYPFGGSSTPVAAGGVIFESGSSIIYQGGTNVFGNSGFSAIRFLPGSFMVFEANNAALAFATRTYANVIVRSPDGGVTPVTVTIDGALYNIDTLTIETGNTFRLAPTGVAPFSGDIINHGIFGAVTTPATTTANLLFKGVVPQSIGGSGSFEPIGAVSVANDSYLTLNTNLVHNGTATGTVTGTINFQQYSISGTGAFQLRPAAAAYNTAATAATGAQVISVTGDYSTANVTIGGHVTGPGIAPNTYIIGTNSGASTFTISQPTIGDVTEVSIVNTPATAITSNTAGIDGSIATTGSTTYGSTSNYIFNAATVTPAPGAVSTFLTGNLTFNEDVTLNKPVSVGEALTVRKMLATAGNNITLNATTGSAVFNPLSSLDINNAAAVVDFNGRPVVFQSDATGTARLAPVLGTMNDATNVTAERFIGIPAAKRAWRLLTAPLRAETANVSVYQEWQNSGAMTAGSGTLITGPNASAGDGLDATSPGHSLKSYDGVTLNGVDNTMTAPLFTTAPAAANRSYFLFVRGDRSVLDLTHVSQTRLQPTGTLQTGDQEFIASPVAGAFSLIGNPYASPVNFASVTRDNIVNRFYVWDPSLNVLGGYVLVDDATNSGTYTITPNPSSPSGTTAQNQHVQSGQAFFVQTATSSAASLTFKETDKSSNTVNAVFRTGNGSAEKLKVNLFLENGTSILADGIAAHFNTGFNPGVDLMDGPKMDNINENLSLMRNGNQLMLERRPLVVANDTLFMHLSNSSARNYSFSIEAINFSTPSLTAMLEDNYLQTSTPIDLTGLTNVSFAITSDPASAAANRFMIVFKPANILPVSFTNIKAYKQSAGINVEWNVATEEGTARYEVEKSADGRSFKKIATVEARNANTTAAYTWLDANVFAGNNFYRIKAIENDGDATYSTVVNVRTDKAGAGVVVYPNPVKGNVINMQMNNQREGNYTIQLFNTVGQEVFRTIISHSGVSSAQSVTLPSSVDKGMYQLVVKGEDYSSTQQLIISK